MSQRNHIIVTHSGSAHLDDFLSSCIVLAIDEKVTKIERRDPHQEEIVNPYVWVLDVGGELNREGHAYDHHQRTWNESALSLLLKDLKWWKRAKRVYKWLEFSVMVDAKGIIEASRYYKIDRNTVMALSSFINDAILTMFSSKTEFTEDDELFRIMKEIGKLFFSQIEEYEEVEKYVYHNAIQKHIKGLPVFIVKSVPINGMTATVINKIKRKKMGGGGVIVYPSTRPKGSFFMVRCDNDLRVDFRRVREKEEVVFAHPSGYMCVISDEDKIESYIEESIANYEGGILYNTRTN